MKPLTVSRALLLSAALLLILSLSNHFRVEQVSDIELREFRNRCIEYGVKYGHECYMSGYDVEFCTQDAISYIDKTLEELLDDNKLR